MALESPGGTTTAEGTAAAARGQAAARGVATGDWQRPLEAGATKEGAAATGGEAIAGRLMVTFGMAAPGTKAVLMPT